MNYSLTQIAVLVVKFDLSAGPPPPPRARQRRVSVIPVASN